MAASDLSEAAAIGFEVIMRWIAILCALGLTACDDGGTSDSDADGDIDGDADGDVDGDADGDEDREPQVCGSGNHALPDDLVELSWDDDEPVADISRQEWEITVNGRTYSLAGSPLYEAVRFELMHPARVYAFAVRWTNLSDEAAPTDELEAGLYPDSRTLRAAVG
jgi:hypothetical protein